MIITIVVVIIVIIIIIIVVNVIVILRRTHYPQTNSLTRPREAYYCPQIG